MRKTNYPCTQPELYAVARTGWDAYNAHFTAFATYRGYYDRELSATAFAQISAAEALPDNQTRNAQSEIHRIQLSALADTCLAQWQTLKRYITTSFPEPELKSRYNEAGASRYPEAQNYNWEQLQMLNVQAANFITLHSVALSAGDNMPTTFAAAYTAAAAAYAAKMQQYHYREEQSVLDTNAKINANNALYTQLINMFKDGQEIFKNQDQIKRQFTFDTVLSIISAPAQAGIRGIVTSALDASPIPNASIDILSTSQHTNTDAQGHYLLKPLPAGKYDIRILAPGYQDKTLQNITIHSGTTSTLDVELEPLT
jgi:hypothetical protein